MSTLLRMPPAAADMGEVLGVALWVMLAAALALAGGYLVAAVRRRLHHELPTQPFTLQELREMRGREQITEREFQALRAALLGRAAAGPPPEPDRPGE
jgi:uncharacterized protein (DUF58 family)